MNGAQMVGVLDIDSPTVNRFTADDVQYVEALAREFCLLQFGRSPP